MKKKVLVSIIISLLLISFSSVALADTDIADGDFTYDNVSIKYSDDKIEIMGEMTNNSGEDYEMAHFIITLYKFSDEIIDVDDIFISNFNDGETKTFETIIYKDYSNYHHDFKIQFEDGIIKKHN
ncbi:MAG: hypothetical protein AWU54_1638 [Candidatus Frackibacter sp. T328-2]|nr:MAG: hypothetical protein AWU54_1638 [Candidatus Frackibacter sp. T328-2]